MRRRQNQRGQVLVIFAGGLVLLLAIAALVIDLGFVWMIRRQEQNAADPGALAAARYIKVPGPSADTGRMFTAACFYARENGFFESATTNNNDPSGCVSANDSNSSKLEVFFPPRSIGTGFAGRTGFVEVRISRPHHTFFAGVVGLPTIGVASSAVGAWTDHNSNSSSLVALNSTACPGGEIGGSAIVRIEPVGGVDGGYIQINSDCSTARTPSPIHARTAVLPTRCTATAPSRRRRHISAASAPRTATRR